MTKYIFVTGGVVSSLGKGITAASLGALLKRRGYKVSIIKMDPYINVDAGAMSPFQHGEVFVTCDGAETDLDLGHYERFIDEAIMGDNSCTTGKVYSAVIQRERAGGYNGATVQVIPHITNEIQDRIERVGKGKDVVIAEIGGTVGDIEGLPFLEAIRQFAGRVGRKNILYCHVTLVPYIAASGELKTKPTQHSVNELRRIGIQPDVIVCRSQYNVGPDLREKIGLFCSVPAEAVFEAVDSDSIYRIPIVLHSQKFDNLVLKKLGMRSVKAPDLRDWKEFLRKYDTRRGEIVVALVGKYTSIKDAYLSVNEALSHAGIANGVKVRMFPVEAEDLETGDAEEILGRADAILVPGGFGQRGVEGKIAAAKYARENGIPYFGLCLGMQVAVIEFARNVLGLSGANSVEMDEKTPDPVIYLMKEQESVTDVGGTSRLGAYPCKICSGSKSEEIYGTNDIEERHRHRFEFNNKYIKEFEAAGMKVAGVCPTGGQVEIMENANHPWMIGVQFHPEFLSRPVRPHPLFKAFIAAALERQKKLKKEAK
ncbi:CTP synthase [Synergistes jonesii]|uniref:CTP synthase n=1 Tax=Synergistes jonesii TaxID=2754 RepID=A0A073INZ2_9BACT|nr:CTP synthase [Synergistes jonesii]KEJ91464.1 CTP synthetase [Synergistes jonesii]OFB60519.1 CTP synthetase [Synergistes jonesii]OFB61529.1 CTP synthetase [Synergistes jonesii]OFB64499.1 CTP synthetase [Synergistes jonesii]OFB66697.1 CTP synthetase [Synergistes jonesii]